MIEEKVGELRRYLWRKWTEPFHRASGFEVGMIVGNCVGGVAVALLLEVIR